MESSDRDESMPSEVGVTEVAGAKKGKRKPTRQKDSHPEEHFESIITGDLLDTIRAMYRINRNIMLEVPQSSREVTEKLDEGCLMYIIPFELGFRLPFCGLLTDFFNYYQIAPGQLMPNGWRVLMSWQVIMEIYHAPVTRELISYHYRL